MSEQLVVRLQLMIIFRNHYVFYLYVWLINHLLKKIEKLQFTNS